MKDGGLKAAVAVLLAALGILLAGCSPSGTGYVPAPGRFSGAREVVLGGLTRVSSLNPLYPADREEEALGRLVFSSLFTLDPRGRLVPDLATGYSVSPDGLTYTVTLRQGVDWQHGGAFGPRDVVATFQAVADPGNHSPFWGVTRDLVTVSASGGNQVTFSLAKGDVYFPRDALAQIPIVSADHLQGWSGGSLAPVGTGPYLFRGRQGDSWLFAANPGYFGGKPPIARLEYEFFPDAQALAAAVADGEVSFAAAPLLAVNGSVAKTTNVLRPAVVTILFNTRQAELRDPRVRRAISLGLDREQLVQGVLGGQGVPGVTVYPPLPGRRPVAGMTAFDPGQANKLLTSAGWLPTGGIRAKDGSLLTLDLLVPTGDPALEETGVVIAGQLEGIGVNVQIEQMDWGDLVRRAIGGNFGGLLLPLDLTPGLDPEGFVASWAKPPNGNNLGFYRDPGADTQLVAAGMGTSGARERLQQILLQDPPGAFLYYPEETVETARGLTGYVPDPYVLYNGVASWRMR